jgi:hypothetical protein
MKAAPLHLHPTSIKDATVRTHSGNELQSGFDALCIPSRVYLRSRLRAMHCRSSAGYYRPQVGENPRQTTCCLFPCHDKIKALGEDTSFSIYAFS